ncbi:unnamed protein product [Rangifer tarandus platyrhynchus]|uniref:Uncharacterized protein n=1 Tax=Rangifer tarandus platyrhynchus TaxID=3082113 RepID=A0AC59YPJ3_RANTA
MPTASPGGGTKAPQKPTLGYDFMPVIYEGLEDADSRLRKDQWTLATPERMRLPREGFVSSRGSRQSAGARPMAAPTCLLSVSSCPSDSQ